jgi:multiple sugar transport system substrate-binding protein
MPDDRSSPFSTLTEGRISRATFLRSAGMGALSIGAPSILAACGGQSGGASTGAATSTPDGKVTGTISFFGWDVADTSAGLGKGFQADKLRWEQANAGATVAFDGVPFEEFVAAGTTRARAGKLGDVVEMLPGVNHSVLFPAMQATTADDWGPLATELTGWAAGVVDPADPSVVAGVPIGAQGVVWYYNRALFERAGLDPDAPPTTWQEFSDAAKALSGKGIAPIGMSGVDSNIAWWAWSAFSPQAFPTTDDVLKVRTGEIPLNDPLFLQTLEPIRETYAQGWWNEDFRDRKFTDVESEFAKGKIGMVAGLITSAINWKVWDDKMGRDAYGVFAAPLLPDFEKQGQFFNPTLIYGISTKTDNEATARSWIEFLASKEGQTVLLQESGQFPNRDDVDVQAVSGSQGAQAIADIVAELGGVDVAQNQFDAAAQGAALQKLTSAITGDGLEAFLDDLARQQEQA